MAGLVMRRSAILDGRPPRSTMADGLAVRTAER
jgi:hypothetical protein